MTFGWPEMLSSLLLLPVLVLLYRRLLSSRAARRAELAALGFGAPRAVSSGWRPHLAPALFLAAVALLLVALARPEATVLEPRREGTVVLAFDVSASMAATDLSPTRMEAAKAAARSFVHQQPSAVRVGVVAFSASGLVTQSATTDRARVLAAIDRLSPQGGTALARGLQTSLSAIVGMTVLLDEPAGGVEPQGQDLGYHASSAVVLLSDGENTSNPDPVAVAEIASTAGVRIYPIGLGSAAGTVLDINGFQVATALNEPMLREIASTTDGQYFAAADQQALADVYESIDLASTFEEKRMEVTALLAAAAAVLMLVGAGLSLVWFGRAV